jgi:cytochrome b561
MNGITESARYKTLSISLHWLTLILMVAIYAAIQLHESLPRGHSLRRAAEDWHIYLGFILLPIVLYRMFVILRSEIPAISPPPPNWQMLVTKLMKIYLYVLMIGAPLLGWLLLSAEGHDIKVIFIPLPAIAPASEGLAEFAGEAHELLGESGYIFIAVHALAALYHHYVVKDNTLKRMLPRMLVK